MEKVELVQFLENHGINVSTWGTGEAKTVEHLLEELLSGEATVEGYCGSVIRFIKVVLLDVYCTTGDGKLLKLQQVKQVFNDGRERTNGFRSGISEKIKPGETNLDAVYRALREELSIEEILSVQYIGKELEKAMSSIAFPGLLTSRDTYKYKVFMPLDLYQPEYVEVQEDKKTYFRWVPVENK